jgi:hypothetical protein
MVAVQKSLVAIVFTCLVFCFASTSPAFGSATNVYITQNGSPSGNCTSNVQTPAFFNNSGNWGSGANQIGPGTTVLLCGTFNFGGASTGFLIQGSGTSSNPIVINADTNTLIEANAFGGNPSGVCGGSKCPGGISVSGFNYIILDGGTNGTIRNLLNGSPGMSCLGGTCSIQSSTIGIYVRGTGIIVRNWNINNMYNMCGASSSCGDGATSNPGAGIRVDNPASGVIIINNSTANSYGGIWGDVVGTAVPQTSFDPASNTFPASGTYIIGNSTDDHCHQFEVGGSGTYVLAFNSAGSYTDWINAAGASCHTDGLHTEGDSFPSPTVVYPIVYDNLWKGDPGQVQTTTMAMYCAFGASTSDGSSCNGIEYRDLVVGTGSALSPNGLIPVISVAGVSSPALVNRYYFNTFIGGGVTFWDYDNYGNTKLSSVGNIMEVYGHGDGLGAGFYLDVGDAAAPYSNLVTQGNVFYNAGPNTPQFKWGVNSENTLSAWQTACSNGGGLGGGCDSNSTASNPNLDGSFQPTAGSPAIGIAPNESSMASTYACIDRVPPTSYGVGSPMACGTTPLPSTGNWDAGAVPSTGSGNAPAPPNGLTATVN